MGKPRNPVFDSNRRRRRLSVTFFSLGEFFE